VVFAGDVAVLLFVLLAVWLVFVPGVPELLVAADVFVSPPWLPGFPAEEDVPGRATPRVEDA
jgi:hypothetical protein